MLVKTVTDHVVKHSPSCGEIREILGAGEYPHLDIAIAIDIHPTKAHFHIGFDEIYFVLNGSILLKLYEPNKEKTSQVHLSANELCVIPRGTHHGIIESSEQNRLCVITVPQFNPNDENSSEYL